MTEFIRMWLVHGAVVAAFLLVFHRPYIDGPVADVRKLMRTDPRFRHNPYAVLCAAIAGTLCMITLWPLTILAALESGRRR